MAKCDKIVGATFIFLSLFVFIYYTFWVYGLQFVPTKYASVHRLFPISKQYAASVPIGLITLAVAVGGLIAGLLLIRGCGWCGVKKQQTRKSIRVHKKQH